MDTTLMSVRFLGEKQTPWKTETISFYLSACVWIKQIGYNVLLSEL